MGNEQVRVSGNGYCTAPQFCQRVPGGLEIVKSWGKAMAVSVLLQLTSCTSFDPASQPNRLSAMLGDHIV